MSYDIHITRKQFWADEEGEAISREEWLAHVAASPDLTESEAKMFGEDPPIARDICLPDGSTETVWWRRGDIRAYGPTTELLVALYPHARTLGAKLQGDDGEMYGPDGQVVERDPERQVLEPAVPGASAPGSAPADEKPRHGWLAALLGRLKGER
ncbi:hypothetical protein [Jannaschia aquimarina]|uniref:hypothetical protein n=1 Tax=Jannaschia aquimarina TaxID=935700 RepID=UPI000B64EB6C|nr:hypothetical protein [Jannaschia aquimarina]SNS52770.1 hypothetical protein SAMN05421775_101319 [Jannaschia aquimarina]